MLALFKTQAKVKRYSSEKDEYGQKIPMKTCQTLMVSISPRNTILNNSPDYADVNFIGVCADKTIDDSCILEANNTLYKVKFAQPHGRFNTLYLIKQSGE